MPSSKKEKRKYSINSGNYKRKPAKINTYKIGHFRNSAKWSVLDKHYNHKCIKQAAIPKHMPSNHEIDNSEH